MKTIIFIIIITLVFTFGYTGCTDSREADLHSETQKKDLYYCPMHPQVTSDKPGVCPICHMDLVKKADDNMQDMSGMKGLSLTKNGQVLANVETVPVKKEKISRTITAFGYLDFTESGRRSITSRFNGRIEKLYINETGDLVRKGQPLFEIYSPDLIQAQNDYLLAIRNSGTNILVSAPGSENTLVTSSKKKLQIMGLTSDQISNLEKSGTVQMTLAYYSPYSGTVIEKRVQEGMYVNEGAVIYELADLSQLWNISEIFTDDLNMIRAGDNIQFTTSAYPGEQFSGKITFIYPVVNSQSRTIKIRAEVKNSNGKLKPQMYTETLIKKDYGESLVVPEEAVLFMGRKNVVWVKKNDNQFEPREVRVGIKSDGKYQILSGLNESELVAASGGYLIDSESQLKVGTPAVHQHTPGMDMSGAQKSENNSSDLSGNGHGIKNGTVSDSPLTKEVRGLFNEVCPVLGNPVSEDITPIEYNGKLYGFCCAGCDKKFSANPGKYIKNLSKDGKQFIKI